MLFTADFSPEYMLSNKDIYTLESDKMICAAKFDSEDKSISAILLAGSPEQEHNAYIGVSVELNADKINLIWDDYAMMRGRRHVGRNIETVRIKANGFSYEGSVSVPVEEE